MVDVKNILPSLDLLSEVEKDAPALAGTLHGRYSRNVPCPFCGGRDRFNVTIGRDSILRAFCRQCSPKGLDAIAYIMKRDGLDFKGALAWWDREDRPATTERVQPQEPVIVAPPQTWQVKALDFVTECESVLWSEAGAKALAYLRGRGLSVETIKRNRLGLNVHRRVASGEEWGINREKVNATAGITIPRFILGELWAINVRRMNDDGTAYAGKDKYICLTGSVLGLAGADALKGADVALAFGGEFDRMVAEQHAPEGVACITFGGEGARVSELWCNMLAGVRSVLVCYDVDKAGSEGAFKWFGAHRSVRRVKVPHGKDLTEFMQAGGNVSEWIAAQVAKTLPRSPQASAHPAQPAKTLVIEHPEAPRMAQDEPTEPIVSPLLADDTLIAGVILGYLAIEGATMPSKVAEQVLMATGWEWCDEVKGRLTATIRQLIKQGCLMQMPSKALVMMRK
jgi:hypothetical protein